MDVGYSAGMRNKVVTFAKRYADPNADDFGKSGQPKYEIVDDFWVAEDFARGTKNMREGSLDAYDTVMFRMEYDDRIDRWCLINYHGKWFQITSLNDDYQTNKIQITAVEMANQKVNIICSPSSFAITGGSSNSQEIG